MKLARAEARNNTTSAISVSSGAIVNVASYASYFAVQMIVTYTASKAAFAQLTRTLALEVMLSGPQSSLSIEQRWTEQRQVLHSRGPARSEWPGTLTMANVGLAETNAAMPGRADNATETAPLYPFA
ncbi:SDR family NAD(P)-dependent oxidoreductase [Paraburkholderia guartelaensis]|uniref:SDR family NAD(P)-dependent oxidoreductase n=1 Tax=Paraburkholderia guartelaensis TaxID=2546446 RepID=UPI002AB67BA2|nr:SDR family NAD(P)-dependent oxidoreductase [Paraburkholderia guartelaensis]